MFSRLLDYINSFNFKLFFAEFLTAADMDNKGAALYVDAPLF